MLRAVLYTRGANFIVNPPDRRAGGRFCRGTSSGRQRTLNRGLIGALLASVAFTAPAVARQAPVPTTAAAADQASEIVVLGTRRTDRTLTNSASPVDIISAAELQTQPSTIRRLRDGSDHLHDCAGVGCSICRDTGRGHAALPSRRLRRPPGLPASRCQRTWRGKRSVYALIR